MIEPKTERGKEWVEFSEKALNHIESYTVPRYGDADEDNARDYTAHYCVDQAKKYATRFGDQSRGDERANDLIKIAHYACLAFNKLDEVVKVKSGYWAIKDPHGVWRIDFVPHRLTDANINAWKIRLKNAVFLGE